MAKFMFAYHGGGMPETEEEGKRMMAAWMAWMGECGAAMVDGGNPVGMSSTLSADGFADGGGANPLSGYSIIEAESIEAAAELGKGCPILEGGKGTIEIAPIIEM
ncbi:YciI family protein [Marinovum sp. 2_MG-2023]|uniref:YciI family protein n=2 Tax=Roseobacteraceae TaxID=2854170 RepID=UPI001FD5CF10|nr:MULTISPECIES: YciI family protein [Roseobacteraceae]MCJ7871057.1 YciI family protein [Phaeobacter sp. J2-8]MDO6729726.1 YciI family protein [Marinovum sp. 2_MG-2023]MDO6779540.1 YciI family protein [Marinovum sp. 1_MG-2023]